MEKVGAYKHPTGIAIWQEGGASPSFQKKTIAFFSSGGKLNDRQAHLSRKRICKPEALCTSPPFVLPSSFPMQQEPCKVIMVATERQLKTIKTQKENKPNSCLSPSQQTNRQQ